MSKAFSSSKVSCFRIQPKRYLRLYWSFDFEAAFWVVKDTHFMSKYLRSNLEPHGNAIFPWKILPQYCHHATRPIKKNLFGPLKWSHFAPSERANWLGQSAPKKWNWRSRRGVLYSNFTLFPGKLPWKGKLRNTLTFGIEGNLQNRFLQTYMIYHVRSFVPTLHHRKYIVPKSYPYERI